MNSRSISRFAWSILVGAISPFAISEFAEAAHISKRFDVDILRPKLGPNEGYLNFRTIDHGEEYTGHTDKIGRDWADNWFTVKPIVVTDSTGDKPNKAGAEDIANDFNFMRKIYAQAGLSVRQEDTSNVNLDVTWANFDANERQEFANSDNGRSPNNDTVNLYFVQEFGGSGANGLTISPQQLDGFREEEYSYVRDGRANNTSAHEIGHQLLNGNALWREDATPSESSDITNLMFRTDAGSSQDLDDVGQILSATVGGHDIIEHRKDGANEEQIARIHGNKGANNPGFVKHANYHDTHGDRADFDWVSDHRLIETLMDGGNGADHNAGVDFLVWEIGDIMPSQHKGPAQDDHDHGNLGCKAMQTGPCSLDLSAFTGDFFKTIDVVSNINLFADNDIDPNTGMVSDREKALDYHIPDFSTDLINWVSGELVNVFIPGWTKDTKQENYVARWATDIEAKYVRLSAVGAGVVGHDGNTQIDAIIAVDSKISPIPEPSSIFGILAIGGFGLMRLRKKSP